MTFKLFSKKTKTVKTAGTPANKKTTNSQGKAPTLSSQVTRLRDRVDMVAPLTQSMAATSALLEKINTDLEALNLALTEAAEVLESVKGKGAPEVVAVKDLQTKNNEKLANIKELIDAQGAISAQVTEERADIQKSIGEVADILGKTDELKRLAKDVKKLDSGKFSTEPTLSSVKNAQILALRQDLAQANSKLQAIADAGSRGTPAPAPAQPAPQPPAPQPPAPPPPPPPRPLPPSQQPLPPAPPPPRPLPPSQQPVQQPPPKPKPKPQLPPKPQPQPPAPQLRPQSKAEILKQELTDLIKELNNVSEVPAGNGELEATNEAVDEEIDQLLIDLEDSAPKRQQPKKAGKATATATATGTATASVSVPKQSMDANAAQKLELAPVEVIADTSDVPILPPKVRQRNIGELDQLIKKRVQQPGDSASPTTSSTFTETATTRPKFVSSGAARIGTVEEARALEQLMDQTLADLEDRAPLPMPPSLTKATKSTPTSPRVPAATSQEQTKPRTFERRVNMRGQQPLRGNIDDQPTQQGQHSAQQQARQPEQQRTLRAPASASTQGRILTEVEKQELDQRFEDVLNTLEELVPTTTRSQEPASEPTRIWTEQEKNKQDQQLVDLLKELDDSNPG